MTRTTYVVRDGRVVKKPPVFRPYPMVGNMPANFMVMRDYYHNNEMLSPVDETVLDSRQTVREHNIRNDVFNADGVGDLRPRVDEQKELRDIERDIGEVLQRHGS